VRLSHSIKRLLTYLLKTIFGAPVLQSLRERVPWDPEGGCAYDLSFLSPPYHLFYSTERPGISGTDVIHGCGFLTSTPSAGISLTTLPSSSFFASHRPQRNTYCFFVAMFSSSTYNRHHQIHRIVAVRLAML